MFGNNMSKPNTPESQSINLIGAGTVIEGDIKSNGDIRIDGTIKGVSKPFNRVIRNRAAMCLNLCGEIPPRQRSCEGLRMFEIVGSAVTLTATLELHFVATSVSLFTL